jgi:hypothetical protein
MHLSGSNAREAGFTLARMKKLFLLLGAVTLVACTSERNERGATMNEPAGAETSTSTTTVTRTNNMNMRAMPSEQPRDINQQPYPGTSQYNPQRGSGSTSSSSLQGSSGSEGNQPLQNP